MKCVFHPIIEADFVVKGNSVCEVCRPGFSFSPIKIRGYEIKALRKSLGLTLKDLAPKLGISESMLSYIENGERKMPLKAVVALKEIVNLPH